MIFDIYCRFITLYLIVDCASGEARGSSLMEEQSLSVEYVPQLGQYALLVGSGAMESSENPLYPLVVYQFWDNPCVKRRN